MTHAALNVYATEIFLNIFPMYNGVFETFKGKLLSF